VAGFVGHRDAARPDSAEGNHVSARTSGARGHIGRPHAARHSDLCAASPAPGCGKRMTLIVLRGQARSRVFASCVFVSSLSTRHVASVTAG
jgi:hypothetical protein